MRRTSLAAGAAALLAAAACAPLVDEGEPVTPQVWTATVKDLTRQFDRLGSTHDVAACAAALNELRAKETVVLKAPHPDLVARAPFFVAALEDYLVPCADEIAVATFYGPSSARVDDFARLAERRGYPVR